SSAASSFFSRSRSARSVSRCELTDTYSPAAIDMAPATRPAMPASRICWRSACAAATPSTSDAVDTIPSLAPSTAARSQPICWVRWRSVWRTRDMINPLGLMNFNRDMHDFVVNGQPLAHLLCAQFGIRRGNAQRTGIGAAANAPDMQIDDAAIAGSLVTDHLADFVDHRMIHFAIQQNRRRIDQQVFRPARHQHGADDAHRRIEPRPAIHPATSQRDDRQHRCRRIGDNVDIGGFQVEIAVVAVYFGGVIMAMRVIAMMFMRMAEDQRAYYGDDQAEHRDDNGFAIADGLRRQQSID